MNEYRLHKEKQRMKNIENYVRISGDSIKDTNPKTLELWNKAMEEEEFEDIIPLKGGDYLIDIFLYIKILEACSYNKDLDAYNIPNVNFTLIDRGDERWNDFKQQRLERGFDDSELWSLDKTISGFILPRLKSFREKHSSSPKNISSQEWNNIIDKMITAFELRNSDKEDISHDEYKQIECGLKLFATHLKNLWD